MSIKNLNIEEILPCECVKSVEQNTQMTAQTNTAQKQLKLKPEIMGKQSHNVQVRSFQSLPVEPEAGNLLSVLELIRRPGGSTTGEIIRGTLDACFTKSITRLRRMGHLIKSEKILGQNQFRYSIYP